MALVASCRLGRGMIGRGMPRAGGKQHRENRVV